MYAFPRRSILRWLPLIILLCGLGSMTLFNVLASGVCNPSSLLTRVSSSPGGNAANNHALGASLSADGRLLVFESNASNLVSGDTNNQSDVFVYDRVSCQMRRISLTHSGTQGNANAQQSDISADGRYVVFWSNSHLLPVSDIYFGQIYAYDLVSNQLELVSVNSAGKPAVSGVGKPTISANGRYIAFAVRNTPANPFEPGATYSDWDIYVRDRVTGNNQLLTAGDPFFAQAYWSVISDDGSTIAFFYKGNHGNNDYDVYTADRATGNTAWIGQTNSGFFGPNESSLSISADGRWVAWAGRSLLPGENSVYTSMYLYDRTTGVTRNVSILPNGLSPTENVVGAALSGNGRYLAFSVGSALYRRDMQLNITELLQNPTGQLPLYDGFSASPALSYAGESLTFGAFEDVAVNNEVRILSQIFVLGQFGGMPVPTSTPLNFVPSLTPPAASRTPTQTPTADLYTATSTRTSTATLEPTSEVTLAGTLTSTLTPSETRTPSLTPTITPTTTVTNTPVCTVGDIQIVFKGFGDFGTVQWGIINNIDTPIILTDFTIHWRQISPELRLSSVAVRPPNSSILSSAMWYQVDPQEDRQPPTIGRQEGQWAMEVLVPPLTTGECEYGCGTRLWSSSLYVATDTFWLDYGDIIGRIDTLGITPADFYGTSFTFGCQGVPQTVVFGILPASTPTSTPTDIAAAPVRNQSTSGNVVLSWSSVGNVDYYEVQVDDLSNFNSPLIFQAVVYAPETERIVDPPLLPGNYFWRVRACQDAGTNCTAWSAVDRFAVVLP